MPITLIIKFSISLLLPIIIMLMAMLISSRSKKKILSSPFECGFNPITPPRSSFSIQFFLIAILFLIFDIEIILLLLFPILEIKSMNLTISTILSLLILMLGLIYEWKNKSLNWLK